VKGSRVVKTYEAAAALCRVAPTSVTSRVSFPLGAAAAALQHEPRQIAERNLRRVLGDGVHGRELRRMSREVFVSYARYYVDSFRLPSRSAEEIAAGFTIDGYHHIEAALAERNAGPERPPAERNAGPERPPAERSAGPILALPHLGGWEWAAFWLTRIKGQRVSAVVEELRPPELFEWFCDLRRELGMNVIPLGPGAGSAVVKAINRGDITCLLSDRYLSGGGVAVEFFGERTMLPAGPATLALRTGAALLPCAVYFRGSRCHGVVRPPIPAERHGGGLRDDVARVTQLLARELEALIAAAPEQWHLLQPNWPSDYAALGRAVPDWFALDTTGTATNGARGEVATKDAVS